MTRLRHTLLALAVIVAAAFGGAWWNASRELADLRGSLLQADRIVRAVDGDTVDLERLGKTRILGIDTPELWEKSSPSPLAGEAGPAAPGRGEGAPKKEAWRRIPNPDPRGVAAYEFLRSLEGQAVRVQLGKQKRDRYGRPLAHLYLLPDGPDLAGHILRQGWAEVMAIPPDTARYVSWNADTAKSAE